ncbi:MAG: EutN/CcmL family microcompartment protein [Microbacterium sp.]|uniref:EutN/CcmL family microcompartment protein n=1 Tax=Microbacterium sp. TaxID=51671 RepID=UPI001AC87035|nr:EutN/CcmL family microcompartment protein [Microbacterium sp.]MBN9176556.1 EutN/CcmL family microcompartment protein [Microbacterium sp.]
MRLGKVTGQVVSTAKDPSLAGLTLLIIEPMLPGDPNREPFVAADLVGAGRGEVVLCVSGSAAREAQATSGTVVDCAVVAIADSVIDAGDVVYSK